MRGSPDPNCALGILGTFPAVEIYPKAKAAALKALELDETVADAHNSLADVLKGFDWDWAAAQPDYKRALAHAYGVNWRPSPSLGCRRSG
jgi:hypothetical protein